MYRHLALLISKRLQDHTRSRVAARHEHTELAFAIAYVSDVHFAASGETGRFVFSQLT